MSRRPGLLALLLLLSAIATSAALNLAFTLPLLLLGLSLLAFSQVRWLRRWKPAGDGTLILGMTAVMAGLAFSAVNAARSGWFDALKPRPSVPVRPPAPVATRKDGDQASQKPAPKPTSQVLVIDEPGKHVADYGTSASEGAWMSGPEESLGYRYRNGLQPLKAKLLGQTSGRTIYDVVYSFDERGNRASSQPSDPLAQSLVVFLGGSFMFGEGLNDQETLPSLFSMAAGRPVVNAGMHGYGTHQAYRLLDDPVTYQKRIGDQPVDHIVYRMIGDHANRASGRYSWDRHGPCYQLSAEGKPQYQGSFLRCGKRWGFHNAASNILQTLSNSAEPFTRDMAQTWDRALTERRNQRRHFALIVGMRAKAAARGADFIVVNETLSPARTPAADGRYGCSVDQQSVDFGNGLRARGVKVLDTHQVLSLEQCYEGTWITPGDGHPSAAANRQLARVLAEELKLSPRFAQ
ncbi:hypothetical protein MY494_07790 [Synechococcus sp. A10-1-5-1]|uniref:hypothetical protein n=1 Tax=Synechococcus sp. A10-1-5-1 TaxID=2936507 RepID=UPI0020012593|nr:hypothetical protein [Synechococcus sp. A10-1-5-1]UPM49252.1 hypothetical protein MY494_07790 [Synechococcus sp. A10-1-5-1]